MRHWPAGSFVVYVSAKQNIYLRLRNRILARSHSSPRLNPLLCALLLIAFLAGASVVRAQDVTTWHYNNARTGVQPAETLLTPSNVNSAHFGKVFSLPVIGDVYAQPLYLRQYLMSDGKLHNVLLIATAQDYIYAFDTNDKNPSPKYL